MFYDYRQNNSGGSFYLDETVGHSVIVEAEDYEQANKRAKEIGLYFDGAGDCPCCGNRWYAKRGRSEGDETPSIYGEPIGEYQWLSWGREVTHVYFLDGRHDIYIKDKLVTPEELRRELANDLSSFW